MQHEPNPTPIDESAQDPSTQDPYSEDEAVFRATLLDIVRVGRKFIQQIEEQSTIRDLATEPTFPSHPIRELSCFEAVELHDRVARAIRRTILLARKLREPIPNPDQVAAAAAKARAATRRKFLRDIENDIDREAATPEQAGSLRAELYERLDGLDVEDDIGTRPPIEILREIRQDLALATDHYGYTHRRTPEDIAVLIAKAAQPPKPARLPMPPGPGTPPPPRTHRPKPPPPEAFDTPDGVPWEVLLAQMKRRH